MLRKASGFYLHVTCFVPKEQLKCTGRKVGIDFGIEHNLTLRNGEPIDICVSDSKGVKLASKRLNQAYKRNGRKKTGNHYRRAKKLRRAYEMIHNWQSGLFGRQVQHSAMGYIKAKLKTNLKTYVVPRSYSSTQICPVCGQKTKQPLQKRDYDCSYCGWHHGLRYESNVSLERRAKSLVEADTAAQVKLCKYSPAKQEAQSL